MHQPHEPTGRRFTIATAIPILLALVVLAPIAGAQLSAAEQVHVTLYTGNGPDASGTPTGLVVQWAVPLAYLSTDTPSVIWTIDGGAATTTAATLAGSVGIGIPDQPPTRVYAAVLEPVPTGSVVQYRVGSPGQGHSQPYTIKQVPGADDSVRVVAYGDIGVDCTAVDGSAAIPDCPAHRVRDLAMKQDADLVIIPGDLAYRNTRAGWDSFMRFMAPLQSSVVTMPVIGNHEFEDGKGYHYFLENYVLPRDEHDFSFKAGPMTVIGFNTDRLCGAGNWTNAGSRAMPCTKGPVNTKAISWFETALAEAAADESTPWTVVYFHHPPYSWGRHGDNLPVKYLLTDLLETYRVDVVVAAHDHLYSRTHPILAGVEPVTTASEFAQGTGIIYLVAGGGGRTLYEAPEGTPPGHYAFATDDFHHITVFDVDPDSFRFRAISAVDESEFDAFTITRGPIANIADDGPALGVPGPGMGAFLAAVGACAALAVRRRTGGAS